ncbi:IS3 family transposase [Photorhabdus sp. S9-53]|nr:IS3 family transposase [Photorhabdus sp. S9-53]
MRLRELHSASRGAAGSRTLMHPLRKAGIPVGRWKVCHLMKKCGLINRQPGGIVIGFALRSRWIRRTG